MDFHKTTAGKKFYDIDFPRAVSALEKIATSLAKITEVQEKEDKKRKVEEFRKNKQKGSGKVNEKAKSKLDFNKKILMKKLFNLKEGDDSFFDSDFIKKFMNDGSENTD